MNHSATELIKNGVSLLAEIEGELVGLISGMVTPFFMNVNSLVLQEICWYVIPEKRKNARIGVGLHKAFEDRAREAGCSHILMAHLLSINADKMEHYYVKKGYAEMERQYLKRL